METMRLRMKADINTMRQGIDIDRETMSQRISLLEDYIQTKDNTWRLQIDKMKRLEAEMESLQPYIPEALRNDNIEVSFLPFFCCCDGKTINAQLGNRWQARCPYCLAEPKDLLLGHDRLTDPAKLRNFQTAPLHVLLRSGEGFFKAGFRIKAGVHKYKTTLTPEEKSRIEIR